MKVSSKEAEAPLALVLPWGAERRTAVAGVRWARNCTGTAIFAISANTVTLKAKPKATELVQVTHPRKRQKWLGPKVRGPGP